MKRERERLADNNLVKAIEYQVNLFVVTRREKRQTTHGEREGKAKKRS